MIDILAPDPARAEELFDLAAKVFSNNGYFEFRNFCRQAYWGGASYDWNASRVAQMDGRYVSHVGVWDYRMRVGQARLRTGGIGAVLTHGDYRKHGLASQVCRAVMSALREQGYHYSLLFGIRTFYDRFGFVQAWPATRHYIDVAALPETKGELRLAKRPLTEALCGDGPIMRLYNAENATRTGTGERPMYTNTCDYWANIECWALEDAAGKTRGYVVTHKGREETLRFIEFGGLKKPCGIPQLMAAMRELAGTLGYKRLAVFDISYAHPLSQALRALDCRVEMQHTKNGSAMGAIVNLRGCLEAMAAELSARLAGSKMAGFSGVLAIKSDLENVALEIDTGSLAVADKRKPGKAANTISGGQAIARLLIGSEDPATLALQGMSFTGAAQDLAEAIFPKQWPMLNDLDHF